MIGLGLSILMGSCKHSETELTRTERFRFSFNSDLVENSRQACDGGEPVAVIVSLESSAGRELLSMERLELYKLGNAYVSATTEVPVDYQSGEAILLTDFLVVDSDNKVIYATPKSGSDLAHLVDWPLPMELKVYAGSYTTVIPQVVATCDIDASALGYITFGFEIIDVASRAVHVEVNITPNSGVITNGLDSVKLVLFTPYGWLEKKLDIIDSFKAVGSIAYGELGIHRLDTTVNILHTWVYAYYESIDEVPEITHTYIEQGTIGTPMNIEASVDSIHVKNGLLKVSEASGDSKSYSIESDSWSYLTDTDGYFTWLVNNDLCNPWFQYVIRKGSVNYLYADKLMYNAAYDPLMYRSKEEYMQVAGWYLMEGVFENMCEEASEMPMYGESTLYMEYDVGITISCWLVWVNDETPIDPIHTRTSGNSPRPVLQLKKVDRATVNNRISNNKNN